MTEAKEAHHSADKAEHKQGKLRKHQLNSTAFKKCSNKTYSCMTCSEV